ncbi:MAG: hypothetical protein WKF83_11825 [Nocardioidaceae bacterium]
MTGLEVAEVNITVHDRRLPRRRQRRRRCLRRRLLRVERPDGTGVAGESGPRATAATMGLTEIDLIAGASSRGALAAATCTPASSARPPPAPGRRVNGRPDARARVATAPS